MLDTVFKKLMVTYFGIIIVSFLLLGLLFSQLLGNYFFDQHEELLLEEGEKINDLVIDYLNHYITKERLDLELQSVERFLDTRIWILDKRGYIYGVSSNEKEWIGKQITAKEMVDVLKGRIIVKKGTFQGTWQTPMLTVGMPILVNGQVENAIIMHSPLYVINNTIQEVHKIIWVTMAISFIISSVVIYILSKKLSQPLQSMDQAARKLALGDFSQRVAVYTEDEIGRVTQTFNDMAAQLERMEENRRSFISAVAHELRSPLTLIKGFVQGIVDGTVEENEQSKYLQIILKETTRLGKLITNLLDLQRMESNAYPIHPERFDICELIRRTLLKYEEEIERRRIKMKLDFEKDALAVMADRDGIEQVLANLIENALKFVDEDGKIGIGIQEKENKAWIAVKDNGIGISKEEQQVIWEKFYKVDKARNRNKEGTGLGLHIAKQIVERHGEQIQVESELGKGTIFQFSLIIADQ
ncbi:signal transduction histidine kinase [Anaerosolibacter carboniphilus]|uniref:histidine kinase n=1 Tax=Anaerosolibacter carboniphilus TaxID=1417629 RepID=A0A841KTJ7_9FIRM|nr:HAMP domain-containing sensor histidine kinase [Anaerosolibacter carboniphilus]MBB6216741.1 signal transduction histidine kinase [Anaerosolibacter carboniphilus]